MHRSQPCWAVTCALLVSGDLLCILGLEATVSRPGGGRGRVLSQLKPSDHISSSLQELHWLPIRYRVQYKLCTLMCTIHHGLSPAYVSDQVNTVAAQTLRRGLRSRPSSPSPVTHSSNILSPPVSFPLPLPMSPPTR